MIAPVPQPEMTIKAFFEDVYKRLRLSGAGPGTIQQYEIAIGAFRKSLGRDGTLADFSEDNLVALSTETIERGLSPVTANMRIGSLSTLWRFAIRRRLIPDSGEVHNLQKLKVPHKLPTAWTEAEMERIVESCRLARGRFSGVPADKFWPALILVLYDTGIRRAAVFQIRFDEIDFANKMLRVPAERMKNLCEQYFRLHDQTIEAILNTMPPTRQMVFPWPFQHHYALYDRYRRILKRAGLSYGSRDLFHKLRRTCASHLARLVGESLAIQQLGHRDTSTIKRYIDPRFTANHDAALMLPRPNWVSPRLIEVEANPGKRKQAARDH